MKKNKDFLKKTILVTGGAGFIGAALAQRILQQELATRLILVDNVNEYYDVALKKYRLTQIQGVAKTSSCEYDFVLGDISDSDVVRDVFFKYKPDVVVNLAAQAGVRYSTENPDAYIESNILGFYNILESCRYSYDNGSSGVLHLVYASSSSVYGNSKKLPYSVEDRVDNPVSLYAATKKSNELMAHAYSKLYNIPATGLRFFTVYGPAGRPDMAYYSFAEKLVSNEKIKIFNFGNCKRDFTYIDDIVEGMVRVMCSPPQKQMGEDGLPVPPYRLYNIGNSNPVNLMDFVRILGEELVATGILSEEFDINDYMDLVPMQPGDVVETYADTSALERDFRFCPNTPLREGLRKFANWYKDWLNR